MASIDKRPDGTYRLRWREYPGGPQKAKHFAKKSDATNSSTSIEHALLTGSYIDPAKGRTLVEDYYKTWEPRQPWRAASRSSVNALFDRHILPTFGKRPIGSLRRGEVESWAAGLPLAGSTAGLAVQYLGTFLEGAVADGLIAVNPARKAKRPLVENDPVVPYTNDELDRLRQAAPDWFRVAVTLGAECGLRQGEATGLTVDRVDFLRRELKVDRQLVTPASGEPALGPLKTPRSYRTVPLADVAVKALAAHLECHGNDSGSYLLHEGGRPVRRQRFGQVWRALRAEAGMPEARFHGTRHTYASVLLSGGVSVAAAADYLGHSPAVLLRTYAHLMPADHDRARAAVQAAFAKQAEDPVRTTAAG